jgi:hypothetical protein
MIAEWSHGVRAACGTERGGESSVEERSVGLGRVE